MAQQQAHGCTVFLAQTSIRGTGFHLPHPVSLSQDVAERIKILPAVLQCHFDTCRIVRPSGRTKSTRLTELPSDDTDGSNTDTNGRVQASPVWRATYVRVGCPLSCKAWYCRGSILPSRGSTHGKSSARACPVATSSCGCRRPRHRGVP